MSDTAPDNRVLKLYRRLAARPGGRWLFTRLVCWRTPYFASIRPRVAELEPGHCRILLKRRRRVRNHIGTVHVIAICNALEMAMGVMAEASIPRHRRWIPKGMEVEYTAKAAGDVHATAEVDAGAWTGESDVPVTVTARLGDGTVVVSGTIHLWVTDQPR